MEERIRSAVAAKLAELGAADISFAVEWPADMAHGDYAVNAAMAAAKPLGKSPREVAEALLPALTDALGADAATIEIAGPGFINITLAPEAVTLRLREATAQQEQWGKNASQEGERVMIEYGNPNPFKEMHIGHLVGCIVGESLARLLEYSGAHVLRDTFGGDIGPHVAKAIWGLRDGGSADIGSPQELGQAYIHGSKAYEESAAAKAAIDDLNTVLYDVVGKQDDAQALTEDDRALLELWRKGREISMEEFERLFALLGTHFDYTFFDSDTTQPGLDAVQDALVKGIFAESDGAIVYRGEKKGLFTLVFVTSRGTPTYETKDIGLAILKEMRVETDRVIIITAVEQMSHFKVVLAALEEFMPTLAEKTTHLTHGLLTLTTGKMSSRKGNIITAAELIRSLIEETSGRNPDPLIAQQVAVGALKYMILRSSPGMNIIFDPEKSLSLDGDSGPYLQYALVRAKSILASAPTEPASEDTAWESTTLERLIGRFPDVVRKAQQLNGPHTIAQYLTQLAGEWNSFYARARILGGSHEAHKLEIVRAFVQTMQNGLSLLGIPAPEKM